MPGRLVDPNQFLEASGDDVTGLGHQIFAERSTGVGETVLYARDKQSSRADAAFRSRSQKQ